MQDSHSTFFCKLKTIFFPEELLKTLYNYTLKILILGLLQIDIFLTAKLVEPISWEWYWYDLSNLLLSADIPKNFVIN